MLLSNEDAAQVWCPYGRALTTASKEVGGVVAMTAINRGMDGTTGTNCLGSACAAWRWAGWPTDFGTYAQVPPEGNKTRPRLGYCGLAGKPFGVT